MSLLLLLLLALCSSVFKSVRKCLLEGRIQLVSCFISHSSAQADLTWPLAQPASRQSSPNCLSLSFAPSFAPLGHLSISACAPLLSVGQKGEKRIKGNQTTTNLICLLLLLLGQFGWLALALKLLSANVWLAATLLLLLSTPPLPPPLLASDPEGQPLR